MARPQTLEHRGGAAQNVAWLLLERVFYLVSNFLVGLWIIRYLGPTGFGAYSFALSLAGLAFLVANLGLDSIVVREIAAGKFPMGEILGTAMTLRILAGLASLAVAVVSVFLATQDSTTRLLVTIFATGMAFDPLGLPELWFQARVAAKNVIAVRVGVSTVALAVKVALILVGATVVAFAVAWTVTAVLTASGIFLAFTRLGPRPSQLRATRQMAVLLLKDSWPLVIERVAIMVYMKIDQVMLGAMVGKGELGLYATAASLAEVWYFIPLAIGSTALPIAVEARRYDPKRYRAGLQLVYDLMAAVSYAVIACVVVAGRPVVRMALGERFDGANAILQIHIWALPFVALGVARSSFIVSENYVRFSMVATSLGAVSNVALNLWLIPLYGGRGAAWATVISYAIAAYLSGLMYRQMWEDTLRQTLALCVPLRNRELLKYVRAKYESLRQR